jgi:hypothetical protein
VHNVPVFSSRNLCGNQLASRVIELLLPSASMHVLHTFTTALGTDLRLVCTDSFASHVLEKLLILTCFGRIDSSDWPTPEITAWVKKVCRFLTNNFVDFSTDTYASHLLRTCVQCVAGARVVATDSRQSQPGGFASLAAADKQTEGYAAMNHFNYATDGDFEEILELFADKIIAEFDSGLACDELASSVVQIFLQVVAKGGHRKPVKAVLKYLLDKIFAAGDETYLEEPGLVRLLETVVVTAPTYEKLSGKLYTRVFDDRLATMAVHSSGNYLVQRLVESLREGEQLEGVWGELGGRLPEVLNAGCTGGCKKAANVFVNPNRGPDP